jgi:hypothetical protein
MASDEQFSGIQAGSVARRARRVWARHLITPKEQVAGPSMTAEEGQAAPVRHGGQHGGTGVVAAVDDTVLYRVGRAHDRVIRACDHATRVNDVCDRTLRRLRARERALAAEKEPTSRWPPRPPPTSR